jgi:hypothetical protein
MTKQEKSNWVNENLNSESANVLMMFVDYLYENNFTVGDECFEYKGNDVGLIHIYGQDDWWIYLNIDSFENPAFPFDAEMTEFMQSQAKLNTRCGGACEDCKTPQETVFFGKTYDNICKRCRLAFGSLNAEQMRKALIAMDMCRNIVDSKGK